MNITKDHLRTIFEAALLASPEDSPEERTLRLIWLEIEALEDSEQTHPFTEE